MAENCSNINSHSIKYPRKVRPAVEDNPPVRSVYEQIYWDQVSLLAQVGLLDPAALPVTGAEQVRKLLDPTLPSNELAS